MCRVIAPDNTRSPALPTSGGGESALQAPPPPTLPSQDRLPVDDDDDDASQGRPDRAPAPNPDAGTESPPRWCYPEEGDRRTGQVLKPSPPPTAVDFQALVVRAVQL